MNRSQTLWTDKSKSLIKELHSELCLNNKNWHLLRKNPDRRAAELLISAISQISQGGNKNDVISLMEQAIKWIKNEVQDPGCGSH